MTRVVFFGNERLISGLDKTDAPILRGLIEAGFDVVAVVSHHSDTRSRNKRELEVADIAEQYNIPVFLPIKPSDILNDLELLNADIAVLAAYGRIISQKVIDIFPKGIVNIHPSLLPQYRGPTPIESAILNGDNQTGVSIMKLTAGMDEGPVYAQRSLVIEENEKKFHLYARIASLGSQLFFEIFPQIIDGSLAPSPQRSDNATYSKLIKKADGLISWDKPATQIVNEIRAYAGWPQSKTKFASVEVVITEAHATNNHGTPGMIDQAALASGILTVFSQNGSVTIDKLKPSGKKEMPVKAFLLGYGSKITS